MTKNKTLAEHHDGGPEGQGGAQQGTGARGEQYLDALARSHKIARKVLFGTSTGSAPEQIHTSRKKSSLTDCPFFRSKRKVPAKLTDKEIPHDRLATKVMKSHLRPNQTRVNQSKPE